jgi:hypothetical protein
MGLSAHFTESSCLQQKRCRLSARSPAPDVAKLLIDTFELKLITTPGADSAGMMAGS